ncbi:MAG: hypothetical protein KGK03_05690 [Candidatus Omnitrophica bacterium]|nr:hypothetical protein [Candidatus Omnitrophota bacterium]MDE2222547.1 hypothetical protein [Candidatus Omnitrophota bacterium]
MKKFVLLCICFLPASIAWAHAPTDISLSYDMGHKNLHVEAHHQSFNLQKMYIRLMNVYVNGKLISTSNFFRQDAYDKFSDDVALPAKVGDVIKVELFCALGGVNAKELKVTSQGVSQTQQEQDNSTADSTGGE